MSATPVVTTYPTGTTTVPAPRGATCDLCGPPFDAVPATVRVTSEVYAVDCCAQCFHITEVSIAEEQAAYAQSQLACQARARRWPHLPAWRRRRGA